MPQEKKPKDQAKVIKQELEVRGSQLVDKIREIVEEGNARRIIIKREGRTILEFPLSVGVGGAAAAVLIAPTLAALGAVGALVSDVKVVIERTAKPSDKPTPSTPPPPPEPTASE